MTGNAFDFDREIDRSQSGALKYDVLAERYGRADLTPLWVADMDFATPPCVIEALRRRLEHPLLGYTTVPPELWPVVARWIHDHHGWRTDPGWYTFIPGIVKGIGMAVSLLVAPEEKVIIQPPVYHPFRLVPEGNRREVVCSPLIMNADGSYSMDFESLENVASDPKARMMILSNPHNPAGITWDADSLRRVAEICHRHDVIVISDEIHADMTLYGNRHVPFASVSGKAAEISITFGAPSKTFNIAGVVSSYAIVPDNGLRSRFYGFLEANELNEPTLFAPIATIAAYTEGEPWRRAMLGYVERNIDFVIDFCRRHIPAITPLRPQASFLVWLDCRRLGLDHDALVDLFVNKARLALNDGEMFGQGGEGFMRLNVASPRSVIERAMASLAAAVQSAQS